MKEIARCSVVIERHESFEHKENIMQDGMTAAQRSAIQKLIRAKSDREIARLLRKSHRLLNLHCRRRSGGPHSERWTDYELRLVGRIRDEELGKLLRRTPGAVAATRESLNIPILSPQRIRWSRREIELLGKRPDAVVARDVGPNMVCGAIKTAFFEYPAVLGESPRLDFIGGRPVGNDEGCRPGPEAETERVERTLSPQ
jgi:hypothetical protein